MSFVEKFERQQDSFKIEVISDDLPEVNESKYTSAQEHLRGLGYKIKLETVTRFGVQIDLAKVYPERDLKRDLKGYDFEIKGDVVFVKP